MPESRTEASASGAARWLPLLVFLSGAAALVYESLWMRSFGLVFGSTTGAVALVLAVFMGGLALGSAAAARWPAADPLAAYGLVEMGAGGCALLTLPLLRALPTAYAALAGSAGLGQAAEAAGRTLLAVLVLLPATVLLGASVPLALAFLERAGLDTRAGFGRLYLLNTLGGAAGVLLATYVLLPSFGVRAALVAAAACSLFAGGLARRWAREIGPLPLRARAAADRAAAASSPADVALALALAATSGASTFGAEVLWTRSLALVVGSSVYAFNLMLLAVLLGIAGGAAVYGRWRTRVARPVLAVGRLFLAAGLAVLAGQWLIGRLPEAYLAVLRVVPVSFFWHQTATLVLCLAALLPVTLLLGVTFPLLLHLFDPEAGASQRDAGRLYAVNTAGAIAGALAAYLWLVPRLGLQPPYLVFAALLLAGAAWALARARGLPTPVGVAGAAAVLVVATLAVPRWKPWDPVVMSAGVHRYGLEWRDTAPAFALGPWLREQRSLLFYREGDEAVVAVSEPKGKTRRFLSVNGKTDAGSGVEDVVTQKLIAHVPMLLHPQPRRALVVGWGAGATAASMALHPLDSLECVEIERATWEAAPFFASLSGSLKDDPRFRIVFADGRSHLLRSRERYDVIVSEPSNPWITGVANLFTREFYAIALSRLAPGGVFGQWFHYYNLAPADVKVEIRTFLDVFPHASLWLVPPVEAKDGSRALGADVLLVGSREERSIDWGRLERAFGDERIAADLRSTRVLADAPAVAAAWAMGREEMERWSKDAASFPRGTPVNTDDYPYVELVAPRRNVMEPAEAARAAALQYQAMGKAAGDVRHAIVNQPLLDSGGPLAAVLLGRIGERYAAAAQPARALIAFLAAAKADPAGAAAAARAGELLLSDGRAAEAERLLAEAVRLDPTRARAWEGLGSIFLDRRDYARAEEAHRALLRLEPANVGAWLRLGAALARQGRWDGAKDALATALSIDPSAPVDPELAAYVDRQVRGVMAR